MKLIKRHPDLGYIDTWLWVPKNFVNEEGTKRALQFDFPDDYSPNKVRSLYLWKETDDHLLVPRSFWRVGDLPFKVIDCRPRAFTAVDITSNIKLDHLLDGQGVLQPTGIDVQHNALAAMMKSPGGILQLACGKGKTVIFLELAARLGLPTLIIVDNTHLMEQWEREASKLLNIPGGLGFIQAERFEWRKAVVLATYHTIAARADSFPEEVRRWFGLIGWDEGHHISAPTFAKSADLFYGRRYALTATPERVDGTHVIYEFHLGQVIYKDLSQDLKPRIIFKWTGLQIDETDPLADVRDKNRELHLSKVTSYFGKWRKRLQMILDDVEEAQKEGRQKILVLSNSIGEVVNLLAMYTRGQQTDLYTDIPVPTNIELGETLTPLAMPLREKRKAERRLESIRKQLGSNSLNPVKAQTLKNQRAEIEQFMAQAKVADKIEAELKKRQRAFIRELMKEVSTGGLMIHEIKAKTRASMVDRCEVIFAIMKYGKEGLDCPELDTVIVAEPFSQKNGLQQLMGRTTRYKFGKMKPVVVIYEDYVGPIIGMCKKLKKHLRDWSHEEGGPYEYQLHGHPEAKWKNQSSRVFGP